MTNQKTILSHLNILTPQPSCVFCK